MKILDSLKIAFFGFVLVFAFSSCDKIEGEGPFFETSSGGGGVDTSTGTVRKVLIEDFTGHTCGNCPRAAETAASLKQIYGEQLVVVAVHMGFFATPKSNPDSSYNSDYRTTMGNELDASFNIDATGLPRGMVNRTEVSGNELLAHAGWGAATQALIDLAPDMDIGISNTYENSTRTVTTEVTSIFESNLSGTYNVVVILTEDSIVDWQKDYDLPSGQQDIEFYVHRHVLRKSFNGTWGDEIASGSASAGAASTNTYNMTLPTGWDEDHCSVVAYVYETTSNEIVQVEETHVK